MPRVQVAPDPVWEAQESTPLCKGGQITWEEQHREGEAPWIWTGKCWLLIPADLNPSRLPPFPNPAWTPISLRARWEQSCLAALEMWSCPPLPPFTGQETKS